MQKKGFPDLERALDEIRQLAPSQAVGYRLYLQEGGTLPAGKADNGKRFFYLDDPPWGAPCGSHRVVFLGGNEAIIKTPKPLGVSVHPTTLDTSTEHSESDADSDVFLTVDERVNRQTTPTITDKEFGAGIMANRLRRVRVATEAAARNVSREDLLREQVHAVWSDGLAMIRDSQKHGKEQLDKAAELQREYLERLAELNQPKTDWVSAAQAILGDVTKLITTAIAAKQPDDRQDRLDRMEKALERISRRLQRAERSRQLAPAPTVAAPAPTVAAPTPTVATPAPTVAAPAPTVATPAPTVAAPAPTVAAPAPTVAAPAPTVAAPMPTVAAPAPTVAAPAPTVAAPAPTVAEENDSIDDNDNDDNDDNDNDDDNGDNGDGEHERTSDNDSLGKTQPGTRPTVSSYRQAWNKIKRTIAGITDGEISLFVAEPSLGIAFLGYLASMVPEGAI